MLWIITKDNISADVCKTLGDPIVTQVGKVVTHSAVRQTTWRNADDAERDRLRAEWIALCDTEFRLLDDDGECYYEGVCWRLEDQEQESAFEPLDWSMRNDGCTTMQYRKKGAAVWKTL
jgi:hypothetical protein